MSTHVRMTVTLEVDLPSNWSNECPLSQIYIQAKREGITMLENYLDGSLKKDRLFARIIGTPKVSAIIVSEDK